MQPRGGPPPPAGPPPQHPPRGAHMAPHPAAHAPHPQPMAAHLQPMHRDARMLTGHMGHAGSASMPMGMNLGLRMRHCPPPSQPPMSVMQPRPCPPPMHRPPPMHHHMQHSSIPTQMTTAPQRLPITTSSVCPSTGMMNVSSQPMPVAKSTMIYTQKSSPPPIEENKPVKQDTILPEPSNNVSSNKEKTPMCLVNELARFNKIQHQYRLTSEQGPAHRRKFTVALRLGGGEKEHVEEYTAEAPRIRAAQHAVAAEALRCTNFPLPPPRPPKALRNQRSSGSDIIMPTVELNALAMKLGEPATYKIESQPTQLVQPIRNASGFSVASRPRMNNPGATSGAAINNSHQITLTPAGHQTVHVPNYNRNGRFYNQNNRFAYPYKFANNGYRENILPESLFRVELTVGKRVFHGKGITLQAARHDAAARALLELRQVEQENNTDEKDAAVHENDNEDKSGSEDKSPVSMVHEIALKMELPAAFSVKNEKGPPHMKVFTTICTVGEYTTEGEGNSKKISKKRAAENMLDKLKKLPSYQAQPKAQKPKRKTQPPKKKNRNLIKEKGETTGVSEQNPVSRLLQWANNKNGGGGVEPVYTLKEETHGQYRHSFIIHCDVAGHQTTGSGTNKKVAKRNAAENMLILLGLGKTIPTGSGKSQDASGGDKHDNKSPRKVTFSLENAAAAAAAKQQTANSDGNNTNTTGRQLVPGVLLMQDHLASVGGHFKTPTKNGVNIQTTATIAKELLRAGTSPTAEALVKQDQHLALNTNSKPISSPVVSSTTGSSSIGTSQISQVVRPKDQLLYLAQLLGFQVQFSDFPKGNHGEFLSLVTLSTEPPMLCHGGGLTTEESHDQSARAALEQLSQMGLDNVTPHQPVSSSHSGDGIRMLNSNSGSISGILTNGISK